MQSYLNVRAINVSNEAGQAARGTDIARMLPAGQEASATVQRVSQSPTQPAQFTIQLQVGNRTLELTTQRPLPQGSQVTLSRDAEGNVQLRLPINTGQPSSAQTAGQSGAGNAQNAPAQARAAAEAFLLRITAGSVSQTNNLPLNQPVRGVVLAQPAVVAQAAAPTPGSTPSTSTPGSSGNTPTTPATPSSGGNPASSAPATATPTTSGTPASTAPATTAPTPASAGGNPASAAPATAAPTPSTSGNPASTPPPGTVTSTVGNNPATPATATPATATPASGAPVSGAPVSGTQGLPPTPTGGALPSATANASAAAGQPAQSITQSAPLTTATQPATTLSPGTSQPATAPPLATPTPLANALSQAEPPPRPQGGYPVRILAAGQVIDLVSPRPIQAGQQVEVTRNEQGLLRLQITQPALPLSQQPGVQAIMQQTLREVLPVQLPLADGLNQLMQISARQGVKQNGALNQLIQSMLGLFSVKPGSADADKAIARNLQQGGLLSEAGLNRATGERAPAPDLKQQLGQLLKLADQLPAQAREQLTQLINSLLARSTAQQISSLQRWRDLPDGGQERHFRLDLPIQQEQKFENAELRITEHRRRDEQGNFVTLWSVRLHFQLEEAGSIDADISLQDNFQLSASFWVEKPETLGRLRERLNDFEGDLKRKGFDVSPLYARLGKMANPEITPLQKRLVDVHT
ncbi:flagellar hook-length control protein FliK [Nitrincola sp.]|uniref:flagellar hook-length control protein FliK n=1 Tax=Nitrincola sp. TaxID=1926584 RepID=UPI003A8F790D